MGHKKRFKRPENPVLIEWLGWFLKTKFMDCIPCVIYIRRYILKHYVHCCEDAWWGLCKNKRTVSLLKYISQDIYLYLCTLLWGYTIWTLYKTKNEYSEKTRKNKKNSSRTFARASNHMCRLRLVPSSSCAVFVLCRRLGAVLRLSYSLLNLFFIRLAYEMVREKFKKINFMLWLAVMNSWPTEFSHAVFVIKIKHRFVKGIAVRIRF